MKLKEISLNMSSGSTPSRKNSDFWNSNDIKWLKTQEINQRYVENTLEYVDEKSNIKVNNINDIVIAMYGETRGKVSILKSQMATNQACCVIKCDEKIVHYMYLYYVLISKYSELYKMGNGGAQQNLSVMLLKDFEVELPNLEKQKEIADRISVYDDKIENNNKIINTLEEIASLLYKRYFMDFEFPNEEGKPYKSNGGQFIDSELGQIPRGFKNIKATELMDFITGFEPGAKAYVESKVSEEYVQFFRVKDLNEKQEIYINKDIIKKNNSVLKNEVLASFDATIGRVAIGYNGCYSSGMKKVVPNSRNITSAFIYFYMKSDKTQNILKEHATGTTILHASKSIEYLEIVFSEAILAQFNITIEPMFEMILNTKEENETLIKTRDLLINELIK